MCRDHRQDVLEGYVTEMLELKNVTRGPGQPDELKR